MNSLQKFLTKFDVFGQQINLTYKGNEKYKTSIGGFGTIISGVLVLTYGIFGLSSLINKNVMQIN